MIKNWGVPGATRGYPGLPQRHQAQRRPPWAQPVSYLPPHMLASVPFFLGGPSFAVPDVIFLLLPCVVTGSLPSALGLKKLANPFLEAVVPPVGVLGRAVLFCELSTATAEAPFGLKKLVSGLQPET